MVQVPVATPVTVLPFVPLTLQIVGVVDVKVTGKPDVAVALAVVVPPTVNVLGVKVIAPIVCGAVCVRVKVCPAMLTKPVLATPTVLAATV